MNNNAWGFMAHGELTTVGGDVLLYNGHIRAIWDPQTLKFEKAVTKVNLR